MPLYTLKILVSAAVFTLITELAKRHTALAALITALPLTTMLVLFWRQHQEHATATQHADFLSLTLWYVLPSLALFVAMPWLLRHGGTAVRRSGASTRRCSPVPHSRSGSTRSKCACSGRSESNCDPTQFCSPARRRAPGTAACISGRA